MMNALYFVTVAPLLLTVAALTETSSTEIIRELEQCISHQEVNGCSIPFNSSFPYRNVFKTACNRHDVCYRCGVRFDWSRNDCDVGFLYDMYYACAVHGIKHKKKTRRSIQNTKAEKGETVKNEKETARRANLEYKKALHHLDEDAETVEYAKEVNSKENTADRNSAGKKVKRIENQKELYNHVMNDRKEMNNSVKGKKSTTKKKEVKQIDDAQELLAHDTASMVNAVTKKEAKKDHEIEKKKSDGVEEGKEGHELEQSAEESAKRNEKENDSMILGEKGHKEKAATNEEDNLSFQKRKKERHAHKKNEDQWNAIIGRHGHSKEKHRKHHSSRKHHACNGGQNCNPHQPNHAPTEKTEKSSLKMISNKYHEIEKMLKELNVLIKTEADKVEKKQNSNEEDLHSSKHNKSKEAKNISGNTIEGQIPVNSTSLKDGAKNETKDDGRTHNKTSHKTETMKNHGNHSVEAHKKQKAKSQKHHHDKELWEGKRRTPQKKEENDVIEKHSFDSTTNNHAMQYENDTVPKRKSFFVKCKLAAYMYFIAVRGFGQKFYREKPPKWCQHGCVKENGKPNLKRRRRPRGLE